MTATCPDCGSRDVDVIDGEGQYPEDRIETWECNTCGYEWTITLHADQP